MAAQLNVLEDALGRGRDYDDGTVPVERARPNADTARAMLQELLDAVEPNEGNRSPWQVALPAAKALGTEWHTLGGGPADLAREVLRLGRALEGSLEARESLSGDARTRLDGLVREAVASAIDGWEAAAVGRRDGWLAFYSHELRNPLNTLVNAVWILRNQAESPQAQRVCDMADRAIRKLEDLIKEVRGFELKASADSPRKPII